MDFETLVSEFFNGGSWVRKGDLITVNDTEGMYFNILNGERRNCYDQPDAAHTVWLVGSCIVLGSYVEDKYTLGSLLQKELNADIRLSYRVRAIATIPCLKSVINLIQYLPFKDGDIIVLVSTGVSSEFP